MATEVAAAYVELSARTDALTAGLARANAQIASFSKTADAKAASASAAFSTIGKGAKVGALAVGAGLAIAVKSATSFESQMSQVKAVTGASKTQMDAMSKSALSVAASTRGFGYTAKDVAVAQTELGKAGLSVQQIMGGGMTAALTLAKAGNLELGDAAAYTANAMAQFGLAGAQAGSVADAMATAANATTADVGDFGAALVQSGAAAKSAGLSFNETMTALTALAKSGVKGSDAGTSLKTSLIQLVKPTNKQEEAARAAGISFIDQHKNMRSLVDIAGQLRERTGKMTQAQRTALFATLAGTDGVRTLLALYNSGPATIAKYQAQLGKSGTAAKQAGVMNDNAAGKFKQLMATVQVAAIGIGNALLPPLVAIASAFAAVISKITAFKPVAYAAAAAVTVVIAAMAVNKVVAFGGAIATAARSLGLLSAVGAGSSAAGAVTGIGTAAAGSAGKVGLLASALPLVANPLGAVTLAVGVGIAALVMFHDRSSAAERAMAGMAERAAEFRGQIQQMNATFSAQNQAITSVTQTTHAASAAQTASTAATQAYINALGAGKAANETEAQFQQRLAGLYRDVAEARLAATEAIGRNTVAVQAAVDGSTKLRAAGEQELKTARDRVAAADQQVASMQRFGQTSGPAYTKALVEQQTAAANLTLAESRRVGRLQEVEKQQVATRNAVKNSSMTDAEKQASLAVVNREIALTRAELKKVQGAPDPKKKITVETSQATAQIAAIKSLLAGIDTTVQIVVTAIKSVGFGRADGGFIPHFATGGTVSGPGGTDNVPAMLTAGEVVLNKKQQALVASGMSIHEAVRRTGGAFAKGGFVKPKQKQGEKKADYDKRVAQARKQWQDKQDQATGPAIQRAGDAFKASYLAKFDSQTSKDLKTLERDFTGTGDVAGQTFKSLDKQLAANLKSIEANFVGTGAVSGLTFKGLENQAKAAQDQLDATYNALTPAEAQLKDLQDTGAASDRASAIADAQAKLNDAQQFGDPQAIKDAQKQLGEAQRAEMIAQLQTTAEDERAQREADRVTAQDAFNAEWGKKRTTLQEQLDGQLEQERTAGADRQALLQQQLDEATAAQEEARAIERAQREVDLENLQASLDAQKGKYRNHAAAIKAMFIKFAQQMEVSGKNIGQSMADGLKAAEGDLRGAAAGLAGLLSKWLETHSPSEKGPLSTLNHWWDGFAPALVSGLDTKTVEAAIASSVAAPTVMAGAGIGAGGSPVTINLTVTDQTFAGMSREQADKVARQVQAAMDRQITAAF